MSDILDKLVFKIDVEHCPRCGQFHERVGFARLHGESMVDGSGEAWDKWTTCPTTGEPILMRRSEYGHKQAEVSFQVEV